MDTNITLVEIVKLILKNKKKIIISTLVVTLITTIVALLMPNYYRATTVFYAASPDLAMPDPIGSNIEKKELYGDKTDINRILTVANSYVVFDSLIKKFNLYEHYKIDSTGKYAKFEINKKLGKLYTIKKNERDAIELSIEDKDKLVATNMSNFAREKINDEIEKLIKHSHKQQIEKYRQKSKSNSKKMQVLLDTINYLKNHYGIYDIKTQGEALSEQLTKIKSQLAFQKAKLSVYKKSGVARRDSISLLKANIEGNESQIAKLNSFANNFNTISQSLYVLLEKKESLTEQMNLDYEKLNNLISINASKFPIMHVVEKAKVPLRKFRPKRALYVIAAFVLSFLFSISMIILIEENKKIKWNS